MIQLSSLEFNHFRRLIYDEVGITLKENKAQLVQSRLYSRLKHYGINSFAHYLKLIEKDHKEKINMINLITTNETYFFREQQHFDFLTSYVRGLKINQRIRVWSAAASVGAEAYSIAMILAHYLSMSQWEIIGTDINTEVIEKAKKGLYCESWIKKIPLEFRKKFCLKGTGKYEGQFAIDRMLLHNIKFLTHNLTVPNSEIGTFNIIFLRNVLIYFDTKTKQKVLDNVLKNLEVGGYLIISLTENLDGLNIKHLKKVQSSVYQKVV